MRLTFLVLFTILFWQSHSLSAETPEDRGRLIFRHGADGALPCRNCHGDDAAGQSAEGLTAPAIAWKTLTQRSESPYDEKSLRVAVVEGLAPDGRKLSSRMPRFALDDAALGNLMQYLQRIEDEEVRGVSSQWIDIGIAEAKGSPALRRFVQAFQSATNGKMVYGRKLRLVVFSQTALRSVGESEAAIEATPVLAWIGDMEEDEASHLLVALKRQGILRLFPRRALVGMEDSRDVRGAFASLIDQSRMLVDAAAQEGAGELYVLASAEQEQLLQSVLLQCKLHAQLLCRTDEPAFSRRALQDASGQANDKTRILLLSADSAWSEKAIEKYASHRLFALADQFAATLATADTSKMQVRLVDPRPYRESGKENDSERLGRVSGEVLLKALEQAGRRLTRTTLMRSLASVKIEQMAWPALDYTLYGLTGTNEAAIIKIEDGLSRSMRGTKPKSFK